MQNDQYNIYTSNNSRRKYYRRYFSKRYSVYSYHYYYYFIWLFFFITEILHILNIHKTHSFLLSSRRFPVGSVVQCNSNQRRIHPCSSRAGTGRTINTSHTLSFQRLSSSYTSTSTTKVSTINTSDYDDDDCTILNAIGVPESIKHLNIGQSLHAFRRNVAISSNKEDIQSMSSIYNFTIERVATSPDIFLLRKFLSIYECDAIINYVSSGGDDDNNTMMTKAETITQNDFASRKHCQVAWLPSSSSNETLPSYVSNIISNLVSSTANILLSKQVLSHPSASVEDLQVVKYDLGGEFVLHHDGEPRILTVIYYGMF